MPIRDGIASRWLTSLPKLAEVAVRRPHFSSQINSLITTVLAICLVWDVGPVPQPDYVLPEKYLNCECQYCSTINSFLAERNAMEFNNASLRWSWVVCRHINEKHRHATEMNMKTVTELRYTQGNPCFLIHKIDRAYDNALRARYNRISQYMQILQAILVVQQGYPPYHILSSSAWALQNADAYPSTTVLRAAIDGCLSDTVFELSSDVDSETRQEIENWIRVRGGQIDSVQRAEDASNTTSVKKRILITKNCSESESVRQIHLHYCAADAFSSATKVSVANHRPLLRYIWSDSLIARLYPSTEGERIGKGVK